MKSTIFLIAAILLTLGCQAPPSQPAGQTAQARMTDARAANNSGTSPQAPGQFDYYLLTLSWAPEYCHGHPNSPECEGSHPGFVVHGLWPQFQDGRWPSHCSDAPGLADPAAMLDIMPDPRLIAHEWTTHGTCTGLNAAQYFRVVRQAYRSIHIPPEFAQPDQTRRHSADEIKEMFTAANPGLPASSIALSCHNRYLAGVEFCLSKTLEPVACSAVRDCDARSISIPSLHPASDLR